MVINRRFIFFKSVKSIYKIFVMVINYGSVFLSVYKQLSNIINKCTW